MDRVVHGVLSVKTSVPVYVRYWAKCEACGNSVTTCHERVDAGCELPAPEMPAGWTFIVEPIKIAPGVFGRQTRILCPEHKITVDDATSAAGVDNARSVKSTKLKPGTQSVESASFQEEIARRGSGPGLEVKRQLEDARIARERANRVAQVWP